MALHLQYSITEIFAESHEYLTFKEGKVNVSFLTNTTLL
jgi:hypothetical protein